MIKNLFIFGTRPEAIKMAPVINCFKKNSAFEVKVCITAQHRQMLDQVLSFFNIKADFDLNLMKPNQNLFDLTGDMIKELKMVFEDYNPDNVFVHGDTTTSFVAALAAFYAKKKVCHIEAGLRTLDKYSPFPEEMNRSLTGRITDLHFAPTETSKTNLLREGINENSIIVTGNTVIDALFEGLELLKSSKNTVIEKLKNDFDFTKKVVLVTGHRRENFGEGFINICNALKKVAASFEEECQIIYPVHLNPNVQNTVNEILSDVPNIALIAPLDYEPFVWLMSKSDIILTDSGGIQEEAPSLGKPVLVMRNETERPEAVEAGTVILVGTDENKIVHHLIKLLSDTETVAQMSKLHNPYGDGKASQRISQVIANGVCEEFVFQ